MNRHFIIEQKHNKYKPPSISETKFQNKIYSHLLPPKKWTNDPFPAPWFYLSSLISSDISTIISFMSTSTKSKTKHWRGQLSNLQKVLQISMNKVKDAIIFLKLMLLTQIHVITIDCLENGFKNISIILNVKYPK